MPKTPSHFTLSAIYSHARGKSPATLTGLLTAGLREFLQDVGIPETDSAYQLLTPNMTALQVQDLITAAFVGVLTTLESAAAPVAPDASSAFEQSIGRPVTPAPVRTPTNRQDRVSAAFRASIDDDEDLVTSAFAASGVEAEDVEEPRTVRNDPPSTGLLSRIRKPVASDPVSDAFRASIR